MSYLEAEYLPYHIKAIPLIFSHIGILFAYHTTGFLCMLESRPVFSQGGASDSAAQASFQRNLVWHAFSTRPFAIRIYSFFNQK